MTDSRPNKADRTLEAARKLFFEKGFGATSNREVAQLAGTSKGAIYDNFRSMEGLLEAVMRAEIDKFDPGTSRPIEDFASFREGLVAFGTGMLDFLNRPETIRFSRLMHEEARTRPEVTRIYFDAGYVATGRRVQQMMDEAAAFAGGPVLPDAGERYVALLKGHRYEMAVLDLVDAPFPDARAISEACFDAWFGRPVAPSGTATRR